MKTLNYDNFHTAPGSHQEMFCKACGTGMDLIPYDPQRYKGIGWGGAIMKFWYNYDEFICPNSNLEWHENAVKLLVAADETPSPSLKEIILGDYKKILEANS